MLYCVLQLYEIQDIHTYIEEYNKDLEIDKIDEEDLDFTVVKNDTRPPGVVYINYPTFQSYEAVEFSHIENGTVRIPHIIHQMCNVPMVPDQFVDAMKSFVKYNPTWQYRFWTYDSGRKLLEKYHPYLVNIYDTFGENDVKKSDLLRYALIYEYGGVYADLDVKNLRSLNKTTTKYACILPTEPFEHSSIIYLEQAIMSSAVLLCRPKHPFYKQLLLNLQLADPNGHPVGTTGPVYLTANYLKYNNLTKQDLNKMVYDNKTNTPYFYRGTRDEEGDDGIYIPNSQYFMDNVDPGLLNDKGEFKPCFDEPLYKSSVLKQRACKEFESRKVLRKEKRYTFTFHYWAHLWTTDQRHMRRANITEFIPTAILYT